MIDVNHKAIMKKEEAQNTSGLGLEGRCRDAGRGNNRTGISLETAVPFCI
jgi:hypothetical protein